MLTGQDVTETAAPACTAACTGEGENRNAGDLDTDEEGKSEGTDGTPSADALATLAAAISALAPGDRDRLAELLQKDGRK
ncbi:MAG: hypothetical protein GX575_33195 [Candidatus Anammoximicrobium sp.]|nr:hypothetical protein [Candidatus Anammoximicrobium sp.]